MRFYSVVIPVYNRPDEVEELLTSLTQQTYSNFEVIIVEDGSTEKCDVILEQFKDTLNIQYFYKENEGQGPARNFGYGKAKGDFFVVFDSDCLIPPHYFEAVSAHLDKESLDAFGGPDREHESFTRLQKAISYSMTSVFTTGGIRGKKHRLDTFHPRSFNMGISREVFDETGGFKLTRMGEDIEFSMRMLESGFKTGLISDAYVYHKRRTSLGQFFKQIKSFGRGRIQASRLHPSELKLVHLLPLVFLLGLTGWVSTYFWMSSLFVTGGVLLSLFFLLILIDSSLKNKSLLIGILSMATSFVQLTAYGLGLVSESLKKK